MSEFLTNIPNFIKQIDLLLPAAYLLWFLEQSLLTYCINCFISLSAYRSQEQYVTAALKLKTSFRICFCCQSFYGLLYFCQLQETRWFYCHLQLSFLFYFFFNHKFWVTVRKYQWQSRDRGSSNLSFRLYSSFPQIYSEQDTSKMPLELASALSIEREPISDPEIRVQTLEAIYLIVLQVRQAS